VARQVKGDLLNATIEASAQVGLQFAENIFRANELASKNFVELSNIIASSSASLFATSASFVASLSSDAASIYNSQLNYAANLADIAARRDIALIESAAIRRGQDINRELTERELDIREAEAAERERVSVTQPNFPAPAQPSFVSPPPVPQVGGSFIPNIPVGGGGGGASFVPNTSTGSSINPVAINRSVQSSPGLSGGGRTPGLSPTQTSFGPGQGSTFEPYGVF
jgi:hypothetical protein